MSLSVAPLSRDELKAALPALARLRIAVFREWPYLYDGDMDYEAEYLAAYVESADAIVVGAFDGRRSARVQTIALAP